MRNKLNKFNTLIWVILIGILISRIGTSMMVPFLSVYLTSHIGLSYSMTGFVVGASYLAYVFGGLLGGLLSDKYGRRFILSFSLLSYAITFFLIAFMSILSVSTFVLIGSLSIINLIAGFNRICIESLGQATLADISTNKQKVTIFSLRYTFANIGNAIGPLLGAVIGVSGKLEGFYLTGVLCLIYFVVFTLFSGNMSSSIPQKLKHPLNISNIVKVFLKDKPLCYFICGGALVYLVYVQQQATFGQIIMKRTGDTSLFTLLLSINAVTVILLQMPISKYFLKNRSYMSSMKIGCAFFNIGFISIAFSGTSTYFYIISEVIFTLGEILILPVSSLFIDKIAPPSLRSTYFGAMGLQYFGRAIGPFIGGIIFQNFNDINTLLFFAILSLIPMILYYKGDLTEQKLIRENVL